jgi:hypothetical protein
VLGVDLSVGAPLPAPLRALAREDAGLELESEVAGGLVSDPVDQRRREELPDPVLALRLRDLDDVAPVELGALEALGLARALVAAPVVEARHQLRGADAEHRHVADRLGEPRDHDRVLHGDVHAERLAEGGLVPQPADGAAGEPPREGPDRVAHRSGLLLGRHVARPGRLRGQDELARVGVLLELRPGPLEALERVPFRHQGAAR